MNREQRVKCKKIFPLLLCFILISRQVKSSGYVGHVESVKGDSIVIMLCGDILSISPGDIVVEEKNDVSIKVISIEGINAVGAVIDKDIAKKQLVTVGMMLNKKKSALNNNQEATFIDNGDGTILDRRTNLVWLKDANPAHTAMEWKDALEFCKNFSASGSRDWRLPSRAELNSLVKGIDRSQVQEYLSEAGFLNVRSWYWSSTVYSIYVWSMNVEHGSEGFNFRTSFNYVWPVRAGKK